MGTTNSMLYMSLLKRFMIRPMGVDSKNCIVLRIIDFSMLFSRTRDERSIAATENISAIIEQES
jgi:hypothetical protein